MSNNMTQSRTPAEILLVEDNEYDIMLARESFKYTTFSVNLHQVENGEECLAFLRKEGRYADAVTPDLILLDLNMPLMDGREVLAEIVKDDQLNHLPVIVLTTSDDERDIRAMHQLRCSSYITKPVDFNQFTQIIQNVCHYWLSVVVLPQRD